MQVEDGELRQGPAANHSGEGLHASVSNLVGREVEESQLWQGPAATCRSKGSEACVAFSNAMMALRELHEGSPGNA